MSEEEEDTRAYTVVINHDEQYSIWFQERDLPRGWVEVGVRGDKTTCLDYIEEVWTDMRPLRVRWQLEELERLEAAGEGA
ncbi:MAG: MbtH family NRPS accessory protein [Sandaracinaceae bacterium]